MHIKQGATIQEIDSCLIIVWDCPASGGPDPGVV